MFKFKNSLGALAGVSLFVFALATSLPLTGRGQVNNPGGPPQFGPRTFYLTQTQHNGSQALTACAEGYHMASLWEIFDTSNFRYNTELGTTSEDSGIGPPYGLGWIRTGAGPVVDQHSGLSNCNVWMSGNSEHYGTWVSLTPDWSSTDGVREVSPWSAHTARCNNDLSVWCVQD